MAIERAGHGPPGTDPRTDDVTDARRDAFDVLDTNLSSIQNSIMAHIEQLIREGKIVTSSIEGFVVEHRVVSVAPTVRRQADRARRAFA